MILANNEITTVNRLLMRTGEFANSGITSENTTPLSKQKSEVIKYDSHLKEHKYATSNFHSNLNIDSNSPLKLSKQNS